jgi:hypothetical protein
MKFQPKYTYTQGDQGGWYIHDQQFGDIFGITRNAARMRLLRKQRATGSAACPADEHEREAEARKRDAREGFDAD